MLILLIIGVSMIVIIIIFCKKSVKIKKACQQKHDRTYEDKTGELNETEPNGTADRPRSPFDWLLKCPWFQVACII